MNETNIPNSSAANRLSQMLTYNLTQLIYVVVKLGIPDRLVEGPQTADELARTVGAHPRSLYRVLRALASLGVFAEDGQGRFELTALADLLCDVPGSLRPFALSYGEPWWWNTWGNLLHSVQTGETAFDQLHGQGLFEYLGHHPDAAQVFNANMTSMTTPEARAVLAAYDFSSSRVVVDIGGGHGALVSAILNAHPHLRAVVLDLPAVIEGTRTRLESAGLADRSELIGGSFFEVIPAGGDTYTLKDILHDWDDSQATLILRQCRAAMRADAKLLVIERIIPPGNDPAVGKLIDIDMMVLTGGQERTEAEYRALLEGAGFRPQRVVSTDAEISIIEAVPS